MRGHPRPGSDRHKQLAKRLVGFDCHLLAYAPYPDEDFARRHNVELMSREALLPRARITARRPGGNSKATNQGTTCNSRLEPLLQYVDDLIGAIYPITLLAGHLTQDP